jgi:glycosyltransferase involved in cell wall biosynthesis
MRILQVSTYDQAGGAEAVAWRLCQAYREQGHESWMAVGENLGGTPGVLIVGPSGVRPKWRRWIVKRINKVRRWLGHQGCCSPLSWRLMDLTPQPPEIVHLHNLHGPEGYFDLRALRQLSRRVPVFMTLHDAWLLTGHCAHSLGCERWRTGCGQCPDLGIYPRVKRDATAYNWRQRQRVFARSRVYVVTPSQWLMDQVTSSMLAPAIVEGRVIPNGIDLDVFHPGDQAEARASLGLAPGSRLLLFAAHGIRENMWKDFRLLRAALARLASRHQGGPLELLALGEAAPPESVGAARIRFVPFERDPSRVAAYYRAADAYVHAARADTFPTVVLEAAACGCPVVATNVGGIPEQVQDGMTGFLTPPGERDTLAGHIERLLGSEELRRRLGAAAADCAVKRYDHRRQVSAYLAWYEEVLEAHSAAPDRKSA